MPVTICFVILQNQNKILEQKAFKHKNYLKWARLSGQQWIFVNVT